MLASIVIRTLNEEKYLPELLAAIRNQKCATVDLEVIIVDSGSSDGTLSIAKDFGCRITKINKSEFTFGRSLNIGCDYSNGEFLVFISGHCIPTSADWLDELCAPLITKKCSYSYGRQIGRDTTKYSEQRHFDKWFPEYNKIPQKGFFCNNANAAITRQAWKLFKFDEGVTGLEDMFLAKNLVDSNHLIGYAACASVFHIHDETWKHVQVRYEREAFALKEIMPDVHFSFLDFLRFYCSSILSDSGAAIEERVLLKNLKEILWFRFNHYWGTYKGHHEVRALSKEKKNSYFYPKDLERDKYTMNKKIVALLPLKANSERVKGKNFRMLAGKPLFRWILDSLLEVDEIDCIVINTDARHLLAENGLVESDRVIIRDRKPELCGDMVSMNLILEDDIKAVEADTYLMTHTTNPLIKPETIRNGFKILTENTSSDSLFTVNKIQTRFYREDCSAVNHDPDNLLRTQDLEPWYEENSCLYYFTKKSFSKTSARIGRKPMKMVTAPLESLDIDEQHDWDMVAAIAERNTASNQGGFGKMNSKEGMPPLVLVAKPVGESANDSEDSNLSEQVAQINAK